MNKIIKFTFLLVFFTLMSCRKNYYCDYGGGITDFYTNINNEQAEILQSQCEGQGGVWQEAE